MSQYALCVAPALRLVADPRFKAENIAANARLVADVTKLASVTP
jgi:hypothetical protein